MERSFAVQRVTADTLTKSFGVIFIIVGILGFIPNPLVSYRCLIEVSTRHNIVHIVSGGVLLASLYHNASGVTLRLFGVIYASVTVLGFVSLNALGVLAENHADNGLHFIIAIARVWTNYSLRAQDRDRVTTALL